MSLPLPTPRRFRRPSVLRPYPCATHPSHKGAASGFSLVEIAMALGIVSFALVALIGMLPVGLRTAADAIQTTNEALVAQAIFAEAQLSPYDELPLLATGGSLRHFTVEARPTDAGDKFAAYTAEVAVEPNPVIGSIPSAGGAGTGLTLVRVRIKTIASSTSPSEFANLVADRGF